MKLTDEEIIKAWDAHIVPVFDKNGINPIVFARAIEAALSAKQGEQEHWTRPINYTPPHMAYPSAEAKRISELNRLYEELRIATDGGSESMTHEDALESVTYMYGRISELEAQNAQLLGALNAMLTHMGMDEDEWNKPTFDQARAAIAAVEGKV